MGLVKNEKIKILCYLDIDKGRDIEILMPLIYYAEKYLNAEVDFSFIWEVHNIYRKKPDLVLIANTIGSALHFEISKYAFENGIKVFALISEGNFRTNGTFNYWGYNTDKQFYQDYVCHWSKRTFNFLSSELPQYKDKMVVTGATGFDRYKIYDFMTKEEFFDKWKTKKYERIIGYAGWAFGKLFNEPGREEISYLHKNDPKILKWLEEQMHEVEGVLKNAIINNPDTLFILKRHPNEAHPHLTKSDKNEMVGLSEYPNVLYFRNEEDIHNLIYVSDIWLGFETTTALEAWIMGNRPTILINPEPNFTRDKLYLGSSIARNYNELQNFIDEFYNTGRVGAFETEERINARNNLIKETIGYSDGLNHLRAAYYLKSTVQEIKLPNKISVKFDLRYFFMYVLLHVGKFFYIKGLFKKLPKFKKTIWLFDRYNLKNIPCLKNRYYPMLDRFYAKNEIDKKINSSKFWTELIKLD